MTFRIELATTAPTTDTEGWRNWGENINKDPIEDSRQRSDEFIQQIETEYGDKGVQIDSELELDVRPLGVSGPMFGPEKWPDWVEKIGEDPIEGSRQKGDELIRRTEAKYGDQDIQTNSSPFQEDVVSSTPAVPLDVATWIGLGGLVVNSISLLIVIIQQLERETSRDSAVTYSIKSDSGEGIYVGGYPKELIERFGGEILGEFTGKDGIETKVFRLPEIGVKEYERHVLRRMRIYYNQYGRTLLTYIYGHPQKSPSKRELLRTLKIDGERVLSKRKAKSTLRALVSGGIVEEFTIKRNRRTRGNPYRFYRIRDEEIHILKRTGLDEEKARQFYSAVERSQVHRKFEKAPRTVIACEATGEDDSTLESK